MLGGLNSYLRPIKAPFFGLPGLLILPPGTKSVFKSASKSTYFVVIKGILSKKVNLFFEGCFPRDFFDKSDRRRICFFKILRNVPPDGRRFRKGFSSPIGNSCPAQHEKKG